MYAGKDKKLAHANLRYFPKRDFSITYPDNKIKNCRGSGKKNTAYHSFAIEHEEKGKVDQGGTRLLLHDDKPHRQKDKYRTDNEVAPAGKVQIKGTDHLGKAKSCGKLGKFSRLDTERTYLDPREASLYVMRYHGGNKQQGKETYIYNIGKALDKTVVHTHDDGTQNKRRQYPHHLHATTGGKVQQAGTLFEIVTGTAHTHPPHNHESHENEQREPIQIAQCTLSLCIIWRWHYLLILNVVLQNF